MSPPPWKLACNLTAPPPRAHPGLLPRPLPSAPRLSSASLPLLPRPLRVAADLRRPRITRARVTRARKTTAKHRPRKTRAKPRRQALLRTLASCQTRGRPLGGARASLDTSGHTTRAIRRPTPHSSKVIPLPRAHHSSSLAATGADWSPLCSPSRRLAGGAWRRRHGCTPIQLRPLGPHRLQLAARWPPPRTAFLHPASSGRRGSAALRASVGSHW